MDLQIFPPEEMLEAEVTLPLSKSMSNRALIMGALASGESQGFDVAECDDTRVMVAALSGEPEGTIDIGAAGTAMRFLTAYYASIPGSDVLLDGSERMRHRPIGPLVEALRQCGAQIEYAGAEGYPPLRIQGKTLHGGIHEIDATMSSQFVSAILMVAPTFDAPSKFILKGEIASLPYLDMTIEMMSRRGINIQRDHNEVEVAGGKYRTLEKSDIERDWSAASYWYSIAALSAGWVTLKGLTLPSLQGDSRLTHIFEKIGALTTTENGDITLSATPDVYSRLEEDFTETPDIVQTVVVACCMIGVPFRFTGVASLRIKETDRIRALQNECQKFGCAIEAEGDNAIKWDGRRGPIFSLPEIDTYSDHRMAMAFAPAALYVPGIVIKNSEVVSKSYDTFWDDLRSAGFTLQPPSPQE